MIWYSEASTECSLQNCEPVKSNLCPLPAVPCPHVSSGGGGGWAELRAAHDLKLVSNTGSEQVVPLLPWTMTAAVP